MKPQEAASAAQDNLQEEEQAPAAVQENNADAVSDTTPTTPAWKRAPAYTPPTDAEKAVFMQAALRLAERAAREGEVPVGCVVVCDGQIVGRGRNRREGKKDALGHAELEAIHRACRKLGGWRLHRCDLYVTLEPCPMCAGAMINARIRSVYYGAQDEKAGSCGTKLDLFAAGYNHRPAVEGGLLEPECTALLQAFFRSLRKNRRTVKQREEQKSRGETNQAN